MTTTLTITETDTLADVVTRHPSLARQLEALGLDYCCGGNRTLADAVTELELDLVEVIGDLNSDSEVEDVPWSVMGATDLVDHIEATHHRFLWDELPRLSALLDKIVSVHGVRHPELFDVRESFETLRGELEPHLRSEEQLVFPMVRGLDAAARDGSTGVSLTPSDPISELLTEHDAAGDLLVTMRERADGYRLPADACATYQATYDGLTELEADIHLHVHKENNLLFPEVDRLEQRVGTTTG